ncbi:MAG: HD family hydrolase [Rhodospirillaceae bacterium]
MDTSQRLRDHAPRTWQRMLSGRRLNLIEPSPLDVEITDIARGLARNARWNGQTIGDHAWSVAQHSVFVTEIMDGFRPRPPAWVRLAGLLHDGSEYVTHDLITPLKSVVGDVFKEVEARLMAAIHLRFGLPPNLDPEVKALIKKADLIAGATEAVQLAGFAPDEVRGILGMRYKPAKVILTPLPSLAAEDAFLAAFNTLTKAVALEKK